MFDLLFRWEFWVIIIIVFILTFWFATTKVEFKSSGKKDDSNSSNDTTTLYKDSNYNSNNSYKDSKYYKSRYPSSSSYQRDKSHRTINYDDVIESTRTLDIDENYDRDIGYEPQIPEAILNPNKPIKNANKGSDKMTKGEKLCKEAIEDLCYPYKFHSNVRPKWLLSDKGRPMELDLYNEELELAIEYNGVQHYKYTPFFHKKGIKDFRDQVKRDNLKLDICDERGVYVITVPYNLPEDKIKDYIAYYLPDNVERRREAEERLRSATRR